MRRKRAKIDGRSWDDAEFKNLEAYQDYFERLKKIAVSMFEWVNLPDSMDARFLELCLFYYGQAALLKDPEFGFINTKCATDGYLNIYGLPTGLSCYSFEYQADRGVFQGGEDGNQETQCVLVMNNAERLSTAGTIDLFASRLAEAERACEVNIKNQKFPIVLNIDEKQKLSAMNMYQQIDDNHPVIFGDKNQGLAKSIEVLKTDVPFIADKVMEYKKNIWNEYLTYLGINNLEVEKKERLVASEATTNNEVTNLNLMSFLAPRQHAAKQFNQLFGLSGENEVSVRVRSDLYNIIKSEESIIKDYEYEPGSIDLGEPEGE